MRSPIALLFPVALLACALLAGCAPNRVSDNTFKGSARGGFLGRTVVICRVSLPETTPNRAEKTGRIETLVNQAATRTPGLDMADDKAFLACLEGRDPFGASDAELGAAARRAGADSVTLVLVTGFGGDLVVSALPPYWRVSGRYAYRTRIVDAASSGLYIDAQRERESSRLFGVMGRADLERAFSADLAALFSDTSPAPAQTDRPGS